MMSLNRRADYTAHCVKVRETYDELAPYFDVFYPPPAVEDSTTLAQIANQLRTRGVKSVLDCACGTGREAVFLAKTAAFETIYASDLSRGMLAQASERAQGLGITFVQSEWTELPDRVKRKFDAVVCLGNSLSHVPPEGRPAVFKALSLMLVPRGILIYDERDWRSELGQSASTSRRMSLAWPSRDQGLTRISLLNVVCDKSRERIAYFTYHNYTSQSRQQLLHLLDKSGSVVQHRVFVFDVYFSTPKQMRSVALCNGFKSLERLAVKPDMDLYAEEQYFIGTRNSADQ